MTRRYPDLSAEDFAHEALVAEFMAKIEATDPERVKAAFAKHVVLTDRQLQLRRAQELYAFGPTDDSEEYSADSGAPVAYDHLKDGSGDFGVSDQASLVRDREESEAWRMEMLKLGSYSDKPQTRPVPVLTDADQLREICADGPTPEAVKARFQHWTPYRLKAAKKAAGIKSERAGFGPGSRIVWKTA